MKDLLIKCLGEYIGATLFVYFGDTIIANVLLKKTSGNSGGPVLISLGWGLGVFMAVMATRWMSGAYLNPALALGFAIIGVLEWFYLPYFFVAQLLGAMTGAILMYLTYRLHFEDSDESGLSLSVFAVMPMIRHNFWNFITEFFATFFLVFMIFLIGDPRNQVPYGMAPVYTAFIAIGVGACLSGSTNFAVNPTRDLGPRIVYSLLPTIKNKNPHWEYAWIPIFGPYLGGAVAGLVYNLISPLFN